MRRADPLALPRPDVHGRARLPGPGSDRPSGGPAAPQAPMPQRLGDYLLLRAVGSGGMGVVYEAIQESLGRHVALKTLPFHQLSDPTRLERFRREARAAARLHHTHIVPVFGVGEHDGFHYYTMQFIRGHGLDAVLDEVKRLRREPNDPAAVAAPACRDLSTTLARGLCSGRFRDDEGESEGSTAAGTSQLDPGPCRPRRARRRSRRLTAIDRSCPASPRPSTSAAWRGSASMSPRPWSTPTTRASSTAISSPPTSCSTPRDRSGSPTSAWPGPRTAIT